MEQRRTCKLCFKSFSNGRALGGHMRSHMMNLQPHHHHHHHQFLPPSTPPKIQFGLHHQQIRDETTESASSDELCYGLRENPKKSFRLVDPEFSFAVHDAGSSVVVQDRESETESSKNQPIRRRSKRNRMKSESSAANRLIHNHQKLNQPKLKKAKSSKPIKAHHHLLLIHESEPVSSVSDTTPEEDVALCLMMLSRASWDSKYELLDEEDEEYQKSKSKSIEEDEESEDESLDEEEEEEEEEELKIVKSRNRAKYQCGTCKKVFRSYQALGGHRASHKKVRGCNTSSIPQIEEVESELGGNAALPITSNPVIERKIHECPVCFRVFGSGQALGGHKRSHVLGSSTSTYVNRASSNPIKFGDNLIDLNLPAPVEDDDYSQIELSAVSDAEFIDPIK